MIELEHLTFQPLLPVIAIALMAAVGLALIIPLLLAGRWLAFGLRSVAISLVTLVLLQPILEEKDEQKLPTQVLVLEDRSGSQAVAGRLAESEAFTKALTDKIAENPDLELVHHDFTENEREGGTHLVDVLRGISGTFQPEKLGGVLIVSDGLVRDEVDDLAPNLAALGAPTHLLLTKQENALDRRIEVANLPRYVVAGKPVTFMVTVTDEHGGGTPAEQTLAELGVRLNGESIWQGMVTTGEAQEFTLKLDRRGDNVIELDAGELAGEITTSNNHVNLRLNGVRDTLRVLLVSGNLYPGIRVWRDLLKSDPVIDLVHFTILRTRFSQDATPNDQLSLIAFPTQELFEQKLDQFDLVIADRYSYRQILFPHYIDNISRYVVGGGALMMVVGDEYLSSETLANTPLVNILPALPSAPLLPPPFKPKVTDLGERHPVTRGLPGSTGEEGPTWGEWQHQIGVFKRDGHTVMSGGEEAPLLILNDKGQGRVAMMLSDQLWLWARGRNGGGPHRPLMRNLVHWLTKDPALEAEALRGQMQGSDLVIERQTLASGAPEVSLFDADGSEKTVRLTEEVKPGLYRGKVPLEGPPDITLASGDLRARIIPDPLAALEIEKLIASAEPLAGPIKAARGAVHEVVLGSESGPKAPEIRLLPSEATYLAGDDWLGIIDRDVREVIGARQIFLLDGWLALILLIASFVMVWWREGK